VAQQVQAVRVLVIGGEQFDLAVTGQGAPTSVSVRAPFTVIAPPIAARASPGPI
jgi:hypothetical protein